MKKFVRPLVNIFTGILTCVCLTFIGMSYSCDGIELPHISNGQDTTKVEPPKDTTSVVEPPKEKVTFEIEIDGKRYVNGDTIKTLISYREYTTLYVHTNSKEYEWDSKSFGPSTYLEEITGTGHYRNVKPSSLINEERLRTITPSPLYFMYKDENDQNSLGHIVLMIEPCKRYEIGDWYENSETGLSGYVVEGYNDTPIDNEMTIAKQVTSFPMNRNLYMMGINANSLVGLTKSKVEIATELNNRLRNIRRPDNWDENDGSKNMDKLFTVIVDVQRIVKEVVTKILGNTELIEEYYTDVDELKQHYRDHGIPVDEGIWYIPSINELRILDDCGLIPRGYDGWKYAHSTLSQEFEIEIDGVIWTTPIPFFIRDVTEVWIARKITMNR